MVGGLEGSNIRLVELRVLKGSHALAAGRAPADISIGHVVLAIDDRRVDGDALELVANVVANNDVLAVGTADGQQLRQPKDGPDMLVQ